MRLRQREGGTKGPGEPPPGPPRGSPGALLLLSDVKPPEHRLRPRRSCRIGVFEAGTLAGEKPADRSGHPVPAHGKAAPFRKLSFALHPHPVGQGGLHPRVAKLARRRSVAPSAGGRRTGRRRKPTRCQPNVRCGLCVWPAYRQALFEDHVIVLVHVTVAVQIGVDGTTGRRRISRPPKLQAEARLDPPRRGTGR